MSAEPESLILQLLRDMRADMGEVRIDMNAMRAGLKSDIASLRADVASDLISLRRDLGEQIVGLRRAVVEYHTSVIGHGVIISELEARLRRVEQRLDLAEDAH